MSEFQYYEFVALDRPLTREQMQEVRRWSTRAEITATRFVNTYEWGDFKGEPSKLMMKYYDLHVYWANWGTRRVMMATLTKQPAAASHRARCSASTSEPWKSPKVSASTSVPATAST